MINQERALQLARDAGELMGIPRDNPWQGGEIGDLGWVFGPGIRRSNISFAVTPRGKVATFPMSLYSPDAALRLLATIPDVAAPPAPEERTPGAAPLLIDEDIARAVLRRYVDGKEHWAQAEWSVTEVPGKGWVFASGTTRIAVARNGKLRVLQGEQDADLALGSASVPYLPTLVKDTTSG